MSGRSTRHPFTQAIYRLRDDGAVEVADGARSGVFTGEGRWIEGALREADPQMCVWIANNPTVPPAASDSHITTAKPAS